MSEGSLLLQIVIIIILTGINAFFSSAEMAIVSLNKNKLKNIPGILIDSTTSDISLKKSEENLLSQGFTKK